MTAAAFHANGLLAAEGLYDPVNERDACGIASASTLRGTPGHDVVALALEALRHLEHRAAAAAVDRRLLGASRLPAPVPANAVPISV